MQILEQALGRLRFTTQGRIVAELALVRIASLEDLDELPALIAQLKGAGPPGEVSAGKAPPVARQSTGPAPSPTPRSPSTDRDSAEAVSGGEALKADGASAVEPDSGVAPASDREPISGTERAPSVEPVPGVGLVSGGEPVAEKVTLTAENAAQVWNEALSRISGLGARHARDYARVAISAPNRLVISFRSAYTFSKSVCERPDQVAKFERALADLTGEPVRVEFALLEEEADQPEQGPNGPTVSRQRRKMEALRHPMIRRAGDLFDAKPIRVDEPPDRK
jgi:DNA polymerase-3 subunit gamma/tau